MSNDGLYYSKDTNETAEAINGSTDGFMIEQPASGGVRRQKWLFLDGFRDWLANFFSKNVDSIVSLEALTGTKDGQVIKMTGYYAGVPLSDMPDYIVDVNSVLTPNGGSVIARIEGGCFVWGTIRKVNIRWYGGLLSVGENDTARLAAAFASHAVVIIPESSNGCEITGLSIPDGKTLRGYGKSSRIIPFGATNAAILILGNYSCIDGVFWYDSGGKDSGKTNMIGAYINNKFNTLVINCFAEGLGGSPYRVENSVGNHQGNVVSSFNVESCNVGFDNDERGEYTVLSNFSISTCNTGTRIQGGNVNVSNGVISDNDIGVDLVSGANDAHGVFSGVSINHNITSVRAIDLVSKSFLFDSCMFYTGKIDLTNCSGIIFKGGDYFDITINEDGTRNCWFKNGHVVEGGTFTINPNVNNPSEVFYIDMEYPPTTPPTGLLGLNGGILRLQQNNNITGIPVGLYDLLWDNINLNAITGNGAYTIQEFYDFDLLNPFIRSDINFIKMGSAMQVQGQITVGLTGSPAWVSDSVTIKLVNTVGDEIGYFIPTKYNSIGGSNWITYNINGDIPRGSFKVVIDNNSGIALTVFKQQLGTGILTNLTVTGW